MTAKTHGYITKEIELEQIYQFILKWFDPAAKVNRYENKNGENNEMAVYFTYKGEERRLFAIVYKSTKFSKTGQKERQIFLVNLQPCVHIYYKIWQHIVTTGKQYPEDEFQ